MRKCGIRNRICTVRMDMPRDGNSAAPAAGGGISGKKVAGLVVLVMILGMIYVHNLHVDAKRERELEHFMQTRGPGGVNHQNHGYIESLKVSRTRKTNAAVLLGFARAAIIGGVLGGDAGSLEGMVSLGALNGILYWVSEHLAEHV